MEPEDGWRVAIVTAPRILRRRLERVDGSLNLEIKVDLVEMDSTLPLPSPSSEAGESGTETTAPFSPPNQDTWMETATQSSPTPRGAKRSATGEKGLRNEAQLIELEREYEEGSGWGEAHSRLVVEELLEWLAPRSEQPQARSPSYDEIHRGLHQWLFLGNEPTDTSPLQCDEERRNPTPRPPSYERGVENGGSRPDRRPWFVVEQARYEEVFRQLPIPAIEPFPEGVAEWEEDEPSPSPLVRFAEWPREKSRRRRFNRRRMESDEEDAVPSMVEPAANPPETMETEPVPPPAENDATPLPPTPTERSEPEADTREDQPRGSVFDRLATGHHGGGRHLTGTPTSGTVCPAEFCSGTSARYRRTGRWILTGTAA